VTLSKKTARWPPSEPGVDGLIERAQPPHRTGMLTCAVGDPVQTGAEPKRGRRHKP